MAERQDEQDTTKESTRAAASGRQTLQEASQQTQIEHAVKEGIHAGAEILRMTREMADRSLRPLEEWRQQAAQGWSNGEMGGNAQENSGRQHVGHAGSGARAAKAHADPARAGDKPARTG